MISTIVCKSKLVASAKSGNPCTNWSTWSFRLAYCILSGWLKPTTSNRRFMRLSHWYC